tara:strand:- start:20 stop:187 length:168 start_codon:yes stop_codon:yes gene_type:complete
LIENILWIYARLLVGLAALGELILTDWKTAAEGGFTESSLSFCQYQNIKLNRRFA